MLSLSSFYKDDKSILYTVLVIPNKKSMFIVFALMKLLKLNVKLLNSCNE